MSIVDDIVGAIVGDKTLTKDDVSQSSNAQTGTVKDTTNSIADTNQTSQTGTTQATTSTTNTSANSHTQNLSNDQISALDHVLTTMSGDFSKADLSGLMSRITGVNDTLVGGASAALTRALGGDAALGGTTDAILKASRQQGMEDLTTQNAKVGSQAGSAFNSIVQDDFAKRAGQLNVNIAALGASVAQQNRQIVTDELNKALSNLTAASSTLTNTETAVPLAAASINSTNTGALANIGNVLKGAVSDSTSDQTSTSNSRTESQSTTNAITRAITDSTDNKTVDLNTLVNTIGHGTSDQSQNLIDLINSLKK